MARVKWFTYLLNDEGQPINGADISIYLAGTTTDVVIYTSESGSSTIDTAPQITTNEDGYFEFFLGDSSDDNGYSADQKFKIAFEKTGILSGYNDYISIFPGFVPVDLTSSDTSKDKTISNLYGKQWEDHRLNTAHVIHGILEVAETSGDTTKNKLVSNFLAKGWEDHKDKTYTNTPHNIAQADETNSDTTKNKLVSNNQLKALYDGLSGSTFSESVLSASLSPSGDYYYYEVTHSLGDNYPIVTLYTNDNIFQAKDIKTVDTDTIRVWLNSQIDFNVKINI